jgi:hypothetical protein
MRTMDRWVAPSVDSIMDRAASLLESSTRLFAASGAYAGEAAEALEIDIDAKVDLDGAEQVVVDDAGLDDSDDEAAASARSKAAEAGVLASTARASADGDSSGESEQELSIARELASAQKTQIERLESQLTELTRVQAAPASRTGVLEAELARQEALLAASEAYAAQSLAQLDERVAEYERELASSNSKFEEAHKELAQARAKGREPVAAQQRSADPEPRERGLDPAELARRVAALQEELEQARRASAAAQEASELVRARAAQLEQQLAYSARELEQARHAHAAATMEAELSRVRAFKLEERLAYEAGELGQARSALAAAAGEAQAARERAAWLEQQLGSNAADGNAAVTALEAALSEARAEADLATCSLAAERERELSDARTALQRAAAEQSTLVADSTARERELEAELKRAAAAQAEVVSSAEGRERQFMRRFADLEEQLRSAAGGEAALRVVHATSLSSARHEQEREQELRRKTEARAEHLLGELAGSERSRRELLEERGAAQSALNTALVDLERELELRRHAQAHAERLESELGGARRARRELEEAHSAAIGAAQAALGEARLDLKREVEHGRRAQLQAEQLKVELANAGEVRLTLQAAHTAAVVAAQAALDETRLDLKREFELRRLATARAEQLGDELASAEQFRLKLEAAHAEALAAQTRELRGQLAESRRRAAELETAVAAGRGALATAELDKAALLAGAELAAAEHGAVRAQLARSGHAVREPAQSGSGQHDVEALLLQVKSELRGHLTSVVDDLVRSTQNDRRARGLARLLAAKQLRAGRRAALLRALLRLAAARPVRPRGGSSAQERAGQWQQRTAAYDSPRPERRPSAGRLKAGSRAELSSFALASPASSPMLFSSPERRTTWRCRYLARGLQRLALTHQLQLVRLALQRWRQAALVGRRRPDSSARHGEPHPTS